MNLLFHKINKYSFLGARTNYSGTIFSDDNKEINVDLLLLRYNTIEGHNAKGHKPSHSKADVKVTSRYLKIWLVSYMPKNCNLIPWFHIGSTRNPPKIDNHNHN